MSHERAGNAARVREAAPPFRQMLMWRIVEVSRSSNAPDRYRYRPIAHNLCPFRRHRDERRSLLEHSHPVISECAVGVIASRDVDVPKLSRAGAADVHGVRMARPLSVPAGPEGRDARRSGIVLAVIGAVSIRAMRARP